MASAERNPASVLSRNILWCLTSLVVAFVLLRLVDAFLPAGIVYAPNATVHYRTTEYEFTANINEAGFRGAFSGFRAQRQKFRIVALGDSFTYGWGVEVDLAWPAVLERKLVGRGLAVEVLNLGWAGKGPRDYADIAERSTKRLRPDLMIVAVLQGDDLQQVQRAGSRCAPSALAFRLFPNISRVLLRPTRALELGNLRQEWIGQAMRSVDRMSDDELRRLEALDDELRALFSDGLINPYLIHLAVREPRYFLAGLESPGAQTEAHIDQLAFQLERIKQAATSIKGKAVVVSVPYGAYVGDRYIKNHRRLGFETDPAMSLTKVPDENIAQAASRAGMQHWSALEEFRQSSELLYYELDQHFTASGNRLFAEVLVPHVEREYRNWGTHSGK